MKALALAFFATGTALAGLAFAQTKTTECTAGDMPKCLAECPTTQKVGALLTKWDGVTAQIAEMAPEAREAMATKAKECASQCPIGSRMGNTMSAIRDALAFVESSQAACAESCPMSKLDSTDPAVAQAKELGAARAYMVSNLTKLSKFAAGACDSSCAKPCDKTAAVAEASASTDGHCSAEAAAAKANCPIRIASKLGAAKAALAQARAEMAAFTPEKRQAFMAEMMEMTKGNPIVPLMPETLTALHEGFQGLDHVDNKMMEFAQAHPDMFADMPKEMHTAYMMQTSLLDEASELLATLTETMGLVQPKPQETAAVR